MFEVKDAIWAFMKSKGNTNTELNNEKKLEDYGFLLVSTAHLN